MDRSQLTCFTVQEAAACLKVTPKTVYRLIRRGDLSAHKVGAAVRITEASLLGYLAGARVTPPAGRPAPRRKRSLRAPPQRDYRHFPVA